MAEGMLAVSVFCMFAFGFYIVDIVDQFLDKIQENVEEIQHSSKILFLNSLSDEELLREIHECKRQYKEAEIVIFDVKEGNKKEF